MRVLSVLAVLVTVAKAGDVLNQNDGNIISSGSGLGNYGGGNFGGGVSSYSSPLSGNNFVNDVFSGSGGSSFGGGNQYGNDFNANNVFGGSRGNAQSLGGNIFGGGNIGGAGVNNFNAGGGLQRGTVQVSTLDRAADRTDRRDDTFARDAAQQEQGADRKDQQERRGDYAEGEQERQQYQEEQRGQQNRENYKQQAGRWNLDSRRQNDQDTRRGAGISSEGEIARSDVVANDGAKALGVKKTAFTNGNLGFENIDYNFDKDFNQVANERGGYKEVTGRDNNNEQTYREKQRDHRFNNENNEAFRRTDDLSRNANSQEWLQNALQKQGQNNQYGAADKLQDAAGKKAEDFKTKYDKRDDRIWNADRARDAAFRGAEDLAAKNGLSNKNAIARAGGKKGVADNKYYGGVESGNGVGRGGYNGGPGGYPGGRGGYSGGRSGGYPVGYGTEGVNDYGPGGASVVALDDPAYDERIGLQGGAAGSVAQLGGPQGGNVRGRLEESGGDIVNAYRENAIQGDLANQVSNNAAESRANAANQYLRDKGLEDTIQQDQSKQGRWANQREGFRDARQQGYNGDNAEAAKASEALDNAYSDSSSRSNLDAANKGLKQAKLDRINQKSNQVDSSQNIRSKKQFYHDKNQGGYNNEGLNYNRNRGNNDFGAQEAAQKEARTRFSNLHQDNKNSIGQRRYEDYDGRRVSNGDAVYKQQNANNGNAQAYARANDDAKARSEGFNKNKARQEFDSFNQVNSQQNQKLWDRANRDFNARNAGNDLGSRTDAAFLYTNDRNDNNRVGNSNQAPASSSLGSRGFGQTGLGLDGFYTSSNAGFPGASRNTNQNAGAGYGNNALNAGNTQFGNYW